MGLTMTWWMVVLLELGTGAVLGLLVGGAFLGVRWLVRRAYRWWMQLTK